MSRCVFTLFLFLSFSFSSTSFEENVTVFTLVIPKLRVLTRVPLRLPIFVPRGMKETDCAAEDTEKSHHKKKCLRAFIEEADGNHYSVYVGYGDDCNGAHVCEVGYFRGQTRPFEDLGDGKRKSVSLVNGIKAQVVEGTCGAYCNDDGIYWQEGEFFYAIELKEFWKANDFINIANSAILAESGSSKPK